MESSDHRGRAGQHDHKVVGGDWIDHAVVFGAGTQPELAPFTSNLMRIHILLDATTHAEQRGEFYRVVSLSQESDSTPL